MDLYRLQGGADLRVLDIPGVLETSVCLIEWPERLGEARPINRLGKHVALHDCLRGYCRHASTFPCAISTTHNPVYHRFQIAGGLCTTVERWVPGWDGLVDVFFVLPSKVCSRSLPRNAASASAVARRQRLRQEFNAKGWEGVVAICCLR